MVRLKRKTRVRYGVASSSYQSNQSLRECANFSEVTIEVQSAVLSEIHVDGILTGANSIDEARGRQEQLIETLKRGRFNLRKWTSNESSIILDLPPEYRESDDNLEFLDKDHIIKTHGIVWQHIEGCLVFKVSPFGKG